MRNPNPKLGASVSHWWYVVGGIQADPTNCACTYVCMYVCMYVQLTECLFHRGLLAAEVMT